MKADKAGSYKLKHFEISDFMGRSRKVDSATDVSTVDAKLIMGEWNVVESVNSSCLSGSAQILDGVGLFYDFPLRGEERLRVVYEDFYGQERSHDFFIHAVSNVAPAKDNSTDLLTYTIHFVSSSKFHADTTMIRRSYHGLISDMVKEVYSNYFKTEKKINVEDTEGEQTLVVPAYTGTETMNFFARRAYGGTSTFRFYENRDGYHFRTVENAVSDVKEVPVFFLNSMKDETPFGQEQKMRGIVDIDFGQPVDTLYDLYNGTYNKTAIELDYMARKAENTEYKFYERFPAFERNWGHSETKIGPAHSKEFVDTFMKSTKRMLMVKDYPDGNRQNNPAQRPKTYMSEVATENWAVNEQGKHNSITVKIYGRNSIVAGSMVEITVEELRPPKKKIDKRYSGKYFVNSVANEFLGDTYMQVLELSRSGTAQ